MMRLDRDALLCDLAETYHLFDVRALSLETVARLSCGLRDDSRIKLKLRNMKLPFETMLQIAILDDLHWLRWTKTKDAQKHRNAPKSLLAALDEEEKETVTAFETPEEFEKRRAEIIRG